VSQNEFNLGQASGVELLPAGAAIDLTNCDREPIHVPGAIQPHGALLVLRGEGLEIVQVSANTAELLGVEPRALLGRALSELLEAEEIERVQGALSLDGLEANPLYVFRLHPKGAERPLDTVAHRHAGRVVLELEPSQPEEIRTADVRVLGSALRRLERTDSVMAFCQSAAREVREISGFDRVMVYRFAEDGTGEVIAEEKRDDLEAFLGLHYPASDIPKQARALYVLNHIRLIADATYAPIQMLASESDTAPLDMSHCFLRSVSPVHLEYLANMGVRASMSVSIVRDGQLWGLIACHHYAGPRLLSYDARAACEFLGRVVSLQLGDKERAESADYRAHLKSLSARFLELLEREDDLNNALLQPDLHLLDYLSASGAAVVLGGEVTLFGVTPPGDQVLNLAEWIAEHHADLEVFATDKLAQQFTAAGAYQDVASGLLAVPVSRSGRDLVLWFRPEVLQTVQWGGNPNKPVEVSADGESRLTPRKSFEAWGQAVEGSALAWKPVELEAALELRRAVVSAALRRAELLSGLNAQLERSNSELDSFAYVASHDLKEPLRGIHNYSTLLLEDAGDRFEAPERAKLETLVRLTQRMEDLIDSLLLFSRVGRVDFSLRDCDLNEIVEDVLELLRPRLEQVSVEARVPRALPHITCDRSRVGEVFSNLIANAVKYNDKQERWLEVGFVMVAERGDLIVAEGVNPAATVFYVGDNGIGIPARHLEAIFRIFKRLHPREAFGGGTGAGLTIAKKIVERHGGQIWVASTPGVGSRFYFTLEA
jgi:two-component system, chemotaxis family, sensor kinase Cph1